MLCASPGLYYTRCTTLYYLKVYKPDVVCEPGPVLQRHVPDRGHGGHLDPAPAIRVRNHTYFLWLDPKGPVTLTTPPPIDISGSYFRHAILFMKKIVIS